MFAIMFDPDSYQFPFMKEKRKKRIFLFLCCCEDHCLTLVCRLASELIYCADTDRQTTRRPAAIRHCHSRWVPPMTTEQVVEEVALEATGDVREWLHSRTGLWHYQRTPPRMGGNGSKVHDKRRTYTPESGQSSEPLPTWYCPSEKV